LVEVEKRISCKKVKNLQIVRILHFRLARRSTPITIKREKQRGSCRAKRGGTVKAH